MATPGDDLIHSPISVFKIVDLSTVFLTAHQLHYQSRDPPWRILCQQWLNAGWAGE
jgi:hypothetical protein